MSETRHGAHRDSTDVDHECAIIVLGTDCSVCGILLIGLAAMFVLRTPEFEYDAVCRECSLEIMSAALARLSNPDYQP